jgi:branched-subunit amino acid permease
MPMTLLEAFAAIMFGILVPSYILYNGYSQNKSISISKQMKMGMLEQMVLMLEGKNE